MNLKGTNTEKNLQKALQGEALAHLKYQFYKKELSKFITEFDKEMDEIIHNEKEHGKIWFKLLHEGQIPDNETNLRDAIYGEHYEAFEMYPEFARIAREEGFDEIADLFEMVAEIEEEHSYKFEYILNEIECGESLFTSNFDDTEWKCSNCGYIYEGYNAPVECPVCKHPRKYFEEW